MAVGKPVDSRIQPRPEELIELSPDERANGVGRRVAEAFDAGQVEGMLRYMRELVSASGTINATLTRELTRLHGDLLVDDPGWKRVERALFVVAGAVIVAAVILAVFL